MSARKRPDLKIFGAFLSVVFVSVLSASAFATSLVDPAQCRVRIAQILCKVDGLPAKDGKPVERICQAGAEVYAPAFEAHFDRSPDVIRRMYCTLEKIYLEGEISSTGYAFYSASDSDNIYGAVFGLRRSLLESTMTLDAWLSWKEETTFGADPKKMDDRKGWIQYSSNRNHREGLLDAIINHEFGHLLDSANRLNEFEDCNWEQDSKGEWAPVGACTPEPGGWAELSWKNDILPLPSADYALRSSICYYYCDGKFLSRSDAPILLEKWNASSFVSLYSSWNTLEDFADHFSLYVGFELTGLELTVASFGQSYDMRARYFSPQLQQKRDFIRKLVSGNLRYPKLLAEKP